ncbi:MAG: carbamate kinase [Deltaproteobacteria bacterium]|nr:carbamate kinase [Deltaproteobacteria bacterium]
MARTAIAVLSFGGLALMPQDTAGTHRDQLKMARRAARSVVALVREGFRVLVVHGNEAQMGRELVRNEESSTKLPPQPLDVCVASTQGALGYLLDLEIRNELRRLQMKWPVTAVVTHALVGLDDAAFQRPTQALGPYLSEWRAKTLMRSGDVHMVEEAGRGWRRVVPSPRPLEVVNLDSIESLLEAGHVVIAGGGGGVAVAVDARGQLIGVEAVIDQDRTAALLAGDLGAELLILLTSVDQVFANFGRTDQRPIDRVSSIELRQLLREGHFPGDSMGPKVEAALEFVEDGGPNAIVTSTEKLAAALADRAGTRLSRVVAEGPIRRQMALFPMEGLEN